MNAYSIIFLACETQQCASGSVVEHLLAKEGVAGSIPVSRFFFYNKMGTFSRYPFYCKNEPTGLEQVRFLACRFGRCFSTLWRVVHWTTVPRFIFLICYINFIIKKCWSTKIYTFTKKQILIINIIFNYTFSCNFIT